MTEKRVNRNLQYAKHEIPTLRKIIQSPEKRDHSFKLTGGSFEIELRDSLGSLEARLGREADIELWHKSNPSELPEVVVWLHPGSIDYLSDRFVKNKQLAQAIREIIKRPLWYFVTYQGERLNCIFCGKQLKIESSRQLGYGPDCARDYVLFWYSS